VRLRCERDTLVDALSTVSRAVSSRGGLAPAQTGLLAELSGDQLHLVGVDGDLDLVLEANASVGGLDGGSCVLPARLTTDIVRALDPGAVTLEADDDEARISSGRSQFSVRTQPVEEFPRVQPADGDGAEVDAAALADALRQVVRAASSDTGRGPYSGVLLAGEEEGLRLVATDTYRLAVRNIAGAAVVAPGEQMVVPAKALSELQRLLSSHAGERLTRFRSTPTTVVFDVGEVRLSARILVGEFPDYRHLVRSDYPNHLVVGRERFLDALRRMRLLVRDEVTPVRVSMGSEGVALSALNAEVGTGAEDVEAKYEGDEITIAFNPSFLIDGVEAVVDEEVLIETTDPAKPALIRGAEADDYRYLLMPVRI
jgi:DNA polymerase III subunit beta